MPKVQIHTTDFLKGLQTTALEDGQSFPGFRTFKNFRVDQRAARRRLGRVLSDRSGTDQEAVDLDGTDQYISVPVAPIHTLGTSWTIEVLFQPDNVNTTEYVLGWGHATNYPILIKWINGAIDVLVQFSDASTASMGAAGAYSADETIALQITRSAGTITVRNNAVLSTTILGSMVGTAWAALGHKAPGGALQIGANNTGSYFDGAIDYLRVFNVKREANVDSHVRFIDPRADSVIWEYGMEVDSNDIVTDRSRYENHGKMQNAASAGDAVTTLCRQTAPVQGIHSYVSRDGERRLLVVAGGRVYDQTI